MKKAKYKWLTPLNDFGVACEDKILSTDYIIHDHDHYEIEIYFEGSLNHWLNGTVSTINPGDYYILSPQDTHFHNLITPTVSLKKIILYPPKLPEYLNRLILSRETPIVGHFDTETLQKVLGIAADLHRETSNPFDYSGLCISSLASLLMVYLLRNDNTASEDSNTEQYELFQRAAEYISKNFQSQISLSDVAKEFYLSPKYFSNAFSKHIGCSFVAYLTKLRVFHAQKLLVTTDKSITDISQDSGFNTFSSFSRAFKSQTNLSPVEYRKKYQYLIGNHQ